MSIVALVTLLAKLSFHHHHRQTPAVLNAKLSDLTVSQPLTLAEYKSRTKLSPASLTMGRSHRGQAGSAPRIVYVDQTATDAPADVQTIEDGSATTSTVVSSTSSTSSMSTTATTLGAGTNETTTLTTSTTTTSTESAGPSLGGFFTGTVAQEPATPHTLAMLDRYLPEVTSSSRVAPHEAIKVLCADGTFPTGPCQNLSSGTGANAAQVPEGAVQAAIAVFADTRTRAHQPLGVIVNYDVTLDGYAGQPVLVSWSLWGQGNNTSQFEKLPAQWRRNRVVQKLVGRAASDTASPEFWVPLPKVHGPFEVQVQVYDAAGVRLANKSTRPFR